MSLKTENFQLKTGRETPVRVIYLLGLGHSGTTLLGRLLNAHSQVVATGGTKNIPLFVSGRKSCACGASSPDECTFWSRVQAQLQIRGLSLADLDVGYDHHRFDYQAVQTYYASVLTAADASVIVDTSRRRGYFRELARTPGVELVPVHIFKDPRAQCSSARRKGRSIWPAIWNYKTRSRRVRSLACDWPGMVHVSYEALCQDPRGELGRMMAAAGLELEEQQINHWGEQETHILGGNRQRRSTSSEIRLDESWRQRLTSLEQGVIQLLNGGEYRRNIEASRP